MPSEEALRLTALLESTLGDWLFWPADRCAAGHVNDEDVDVGDVCQECLHEAFERQIPPWSWGAGDTDPGMAARGDLLCEFEAHPDPTWLIGRGAPHDLDDPDRLWAAWGRWLATMGAEAPTMEVYWSENNRTWAAAWPPKPWGPKHIETGDTPAYALRAAWLAWLSREPAEVPE